MLETNSIITRLIDRVEDTVPRNFCPCYCYYYYYYYYYYYKK
jgi:hypothetical protein